MELSQAEIIQKPKMQELSSLFMTHRLNVMHAPIKFHEYIPYGLGVMARTRFTIWKSREIIQKPKMQEFSSLLMTLCLFALRFYGPVNPMGSCRARSVYLTTHLLGRLSPLTG